MNKMYNPIFENEADRIGDIRRLKRGIYNRATKDHFLDFGEKVMQFVKKHPIIMLIGLLFFVITDKH